MNNICIIPARGNSKRIKNKNIKKFNNLPIISFAIKAATKTNLFDHIIVSTDSRNITSIAKEYGAEVPFKRPENLADDHTKTQPVINHAIEACENLGWNFDFVCCIYPCVPLINYKDIINSFNLLNSSENKFILPIAETLSNSHRALGIKKDNSIYSLFPDFEITRTQDLMKTFFDVGQFYWGHKYLWKTSNSIHNNSKGLIIPKWRALDIDNEEDWLMAELMYTILETRGKIEPL